jgi:hypothetical protein
MEFLSIRKSACFNKTETAAVKTAVDAYNASIKTLQILKD